MVSTSCKYHFRRIKIFSLILRLKERNKTWINMIIQCPLFFGLLGFLCLVTSFVSSRPHCQAEWSIFKSCTDKTSDCATMYGSSIISYFVSLKRVTNKWQRSTRDSSNHVRKVLSLPLALKLRGDYRVYCHEVLIKESEGSRTFSGQQVQMSPKPRRVVKFRVSC